MSGYMSSYTSKYGDTIKHGDFFVDQNGNYNVWRRNTLQHLNLGAVSNTITSENSPSPSGKTGSLVPAVLLLR